MNLWQKPYFDLQELSCPNSKSITLEKRMSLCKRCQVYKYPPLSNWAWYTSSWMDSLPLLFQKIQALKMRKEEEERERLHLPRNQACCTKCYGPMPDCRAVKHLLITFGCISSPTLLSPWVLAWLQILPVTVMCNIWLQILPVTVGLSRAWLTDLERHFPCPLDYI